MTMPTTETDATPIKEREGSTPARRFTPTRARQSRNWFVRLFRENLRIKALSLILALVFFLLVRTEQGNEVEIDIPVQLNALSDDLIFVGEMPKKIKVLVRYKWTRPKKDAVPQPYVVDLRGFENQKVFKFDTEVIRKSLETEGITILSVYPPEFTVEVEPKIEKVIKVKLNLVGIAQKGYVVMSEQAKVNPPTINVRGAKSAVKDIDFFATYPIDIGKFNKDVHLENIPLQKPSSKFLFMETETVSVELPVNEIVGQKVIEKLDVKVRNCPTGFRCVVTPAVVDVTLDGPLPTIFRIENGQEKLEAYVDAGMFEAKEEKHSGIKVSCERPPALKCSEDVKSVTLIVQKETAEVPR